MKKKVAYSVIPTDKKDDIENMAWYMQTATFEVLAFVIAEYLQNFIVLQSLS